tara:strand:- start:28 stop:303 length:276 start_codon:yes stop_codon:yes gene_type:complete
MNVSNEPQEETAGLTKEDLAIASYALAEVFNSFLAAYGEDDYGDGTKEQMETSMDKIRTTFIKFDSLLQYINTSEDQQSENSEEGANESEG